MKAPSEPLSYLELEKFYKFRRVRDEEERETDDSDVASVGAIVDADELAWGPDLWKFVSNNIALKIDCNSLSNREAEILEIVHSRFTNYVTSRLVSCARANVEILIRQEEKQLKDLDQQKIDAAIKASIPLILEIDDLLADKLVFLLEKICRRVIMKAGELKPMQKKRIKAFATVSAHRCYLCGRILHYPQRPFGEEIEKSDGESQKIFETRVESLNENRKKRTFEIEHLWPQARGGGNHERNLAASCNECNKLKADLLSFTDIAIEKFHAVTDDEQSVRAAANYEIRMALFWRQSGKCFHCDRKFYSLQSESAYLIRKESDDAWSFLNVYFACSECFTKYDLRGVKIRA